MTGLMVPSFLNGTLVTPDGAVAAPQWLSILLGLFSLLLFVRLQQPMPVDPTSLDPERAKPSHPRSSRRMSIELPVELSMDGVSGLGLTRDVSLGGCHVTGQTILAVGDYVSVCLYLPPPEPTVLVEVAAVRWVRAVEFGVEFLSIAELDKKHLTSFMESQKSRETTT